MTEKVKPFVMCRNFDCDNRIYTTNLKNNLCEDCRAKLESMQYDLLVCGEVKCSWMKLREFGTGQTHIVDCFCKQSEEEEGEDL